MNARLWAGVTRGGSSSPVARRTPEASRPRWHLRRFADRSPDAHQGSGVRAGQGCSGPLDLSKIDLNTAAPVALVFNPGLRGSVHVGGSTLKQAAGATRRLMSFLRIARVVSSIRGLPVLESG